MLSFPSSVVPLPPVSSTSKMVTADGAPPPLVETCVLLPEEFALKVESPNSRVPPALLNLLPHLSSNTPGQSPLPPSLLERLGPSLGPMGSPLTPLSPALSPLGMNLGGSTNSEDCIKVCATRRLPAHTRYLPFSGTVRADKLPQLPCLPPMDPRQRYGSYDEVCERATGRVRLCNWVRFIGYSLHFSPQVNMVASKVRGSVVFEVVREVSPGERLLAFLLPDMTADDNLLLPALTFLRSSLYRRTIDSIMSEAPLDLSRSLLTSPSSPPPSDDRSTSVGSLKRKSEDQSPVRSPSPLPSSPLPSSPSSISSPTSSIPHFPHIPPSFFQLRRPTVGLGFHDLKSGGLSSLSTEMTPPLSSGLSHMNSRIRTPSTSDLNNKHSSETPISIGPPKRRERTMLPCSECGKTFDRPSLLKRHIRTHTGEKPHVCDVCGKGFSTSSSLNTHRRIHSGEKPHQCGVCGKRFTASSNLYYHKMTHVKEKPHKCSLCTRSFPTPGDLRSHMFVHNGQWPHKCSVCGKGFSKLTNLRNHALLHADMKRTERHLTLLPPSLSSPPSTSTSDIPLTLTPPAGYTPPSYSSYTPSTSHNSPSSIPIDGPPSPSTSHVSKSPPPSSSESIDLSSPSSPIIHPTQDEESAVKLSQISENNPLPPQVKLEPKCDKDVEEPINEKYSRNPVLSIAKFASMRNNVMKSEDDNSVQGDEKLVPNTKHESLLNNKTMIASSPASLSTPKGATPKLSFSLDSLLALSKCKDDKKSAEFVPKEEDLVRRKEENNDMLVRDRFENQVYQNDSTSVTVEANHQPIER